jgi:hypothetical protein
VVEDLQNNLMWFMFEKDHIIDLENPGKSLNLEKKFRDWKVLENQ